MPPATMITRLGFAAVQSLANLVASRMKMLPDWFGGRRVYGVVFLAALSMLAGCLSFRSVSATAGVGQLVGARAVSVTIMPLYCDAENE